MSGVGKVVCVTGASGFIASWLVKFLLQRGYTVKASVRDTDDRKKTEHLRALAGANERLHLFKANLLEQGSFDAEIDGCDGVFHTASPVYLQTTNPQAELIEPALKGTLNVLNSCLKSSASVKRVIFTSSMAAVAYNEKPRSPDTIVDEAWFSNADFCQNFEAWYCLSKTLAEEAAWKFAKDHDIDLVTINPAVVIGPLLQPTLNFSCGEILNLINGSCTYKNNAYGWVDVKDVCEAHILAFENPLASGRLCLVETVIHFSEVVKIIKKLYPFLQVPEKCENSNTKEPSYQVSKEKAKGLGINFTPMEESIKQTIDSLKAKGFVSF